MTHISQGTTGSILDHYQNVIEGSATLKGVPGSRSNERILVDGLTLTAASGNTTTMAPSSPSAAVVAKNWAPTNEAPYFLVCTSATESEIVDAARKISAWDGTTFTVAKAFDATVTASDTFKIAQGFRRIPNGIDLIGDGEDSPDTGWDRFFSLEALPGEIVPFYGKGLRSYETDLTVKLRMLKHGRQQDAHSSVYENLRIIRDTMTKRENLESTYGRALFAENGGEEILAEDATKVVGQITLKLLYRVDLTHR